MEAKSRWTRKKKAQAEEIKYVRRADGITQRQNKETKIRKGFKMTLMNKKIEKCERRWFGDMTRINKASQTKKIWNSRTGGKRSRGGFHKLGMS